MLQSKSNFNSDLKFICEDQVNYLKECENFCYFFNFFFISCCRKLENKNFTLESILKNCTNNKNFVDHEIGEDCGDEVYPLEYAEFELKHAKVKTNKLSLIITFLLILLLILLTSFINYYH
jgi:hypothetical protein